MFGFPWRDVSAHLISRQSEDKPLLNAEKNKTENMEAKILHAKGEEKGRVWGLLKMGYVVGKS